MITSEQFDQQFKKLQASFGYAKSEKIQDGWFEEFENCDYVPFVKAMKRLQYGTKFPTWEMFRFEYSCLASGEISRKPVIAGCVGCNNGKIFYRAYARKIKEVKDRIGCCLKCVPDMPGLGKVNPDWLHKDKAGVYRLPEALKKDRETGALRPDNDPDVELVMQAPSRPQGGEEIAKDLSRPLPYETDDPDKEKIRAENLKEDRARDLAGAHN